MSKRILWTLLVVVAVVAVLLLCGFGFRLHARQSYIALDVPSSEMRSMQTLGEPLTSRTLRERPLYAQGQTIYNMRYCPQTKTVCVTLRDPQFPTLGVRILLADGEELFGHYFPGETRYGIIKAFFEPIDDPNELQALDFISVGSPDSEERFANFQRIPLTNG